MCLKTLIAHLKIILLTLKIIVQGGNYAVAGGCAMKFHGGTFQTNDADICRKPSAAMGDVTNSAVLSRL